MYFLPKYRHFYMFIRLVKCFFWNFTNHGISQLYTLTSVFNRYIKLRACALKFIYRLNTSITVCKLYLVKICLWIGLALSAFPLFFSRGDSRVFLTFLHDFTKDSGGYRASCNTDPRSFASNSHQSYFCNWFSGFWLS